MVSESDKIQVRDPVPDVFYIGQLDFKLDNHVIL